MADKVMHLSVRKLCSSQIKEIDFTTGGEGLGITMRNDKVFDVVHEEDGFWYFWDETGADRMGPYDSQDEARAELVDYCQYLTTGHRKEVK